jgi:hypothetical protein
MWQRRFISLIPYLAFSGSLQPRKSDVGEQVLRAQHDFNDRLAHPLRYVVVAAALPFAVIPAISIRLLIGSSTMAHSVAGEVLQMSTVVAFVAWCYGVGAVAWTLYCGGWLIRSLPERFRIVIRLGHSDRCGGLRELGLAAFWLSSPVLTGFLVVCTWLLALRRVFFASLMVIIPTTVLLAAMTVVAFLWPLWRIHETLIVQRREYESEYGSLIECALKALSDCAADLDDERLAAAAKRVEIIRQLEPINVGFPAWPFDTAVVLRLVLPQIGALILAVASRFVK